MMHDASSFYAQWPGRMSLAKAKNPDIAKAFGPFFKELMKDDTAVGGLSAKHKELIALGVGVASRCDACIYTHVEKCLKAGATPREVMDAAGVAVMMGGGPVYTYTSVVAAALEHFERQPVNA